MTAEKILIQLINIPSASGQEKEILNWIEIYLEKLGLKVEKYGGNLAVKIEGWDKKSAIIFNTHVDTVSGKFEKAKIVRGRVVGLGASDEKSAVAVCLKLAEKLIQKPPECDVWLTFVVNEEIDGSGSRTLVSRLKPVWKKYKQVGVVLGEPTGLRSVANQNKGNIFLKATVKGDNGHGAVPKMVKVKAINEMDKLRKIIVNKWMGNMTGIWAGDPNQANKFPTKCEAVFDIRTTQVNHENVVRWSKSYKKADLEFLYQPASPGFTEPTNRIVKAALAVTGSEPISFPGSTDLCFFTDAGFPGIIFGPGETHQMHKSGEYCLVSKVRKGVGVYRDLIHKFCVVE